MSQHLHAAQRDGLQQALQRLRTRLLAEQAGHLDGLSRAEHARELLLQDGDDAPQRDADREVDLARSDREVVALADIDAALLRLQQGSYGRCADCDAEIPHARLALQPAALRCVACEALRERGQPRPNRL